MKKIYFGGAIRAGREDAVLYGKIIVHLRSFGTVLTEHVGDPTLLVEGEGLSDAEIYERDMAWVRESDILVAEVTTPSHGVGMELNEAQAGDKLILCLYRTGSERLLSAMVRGCKRFRIIEYNDLEDLKPQLDAALAGV